MSVANISWFQAVTDNLAGLGEDLKEHKRLGMDIDHVAEFVIWFVLPYASRHGLAISEKLSRFMEEADLLLDMEDHDTEPLSSGVSDTRHCRRSTCSLIGFRKLVIKVWMHDLMDDCELESRHFNVFLRILRTIQGI
jgi:hypothetical protein